jgi:predicted nucleic acid-binding protein
VIVVDASLILHIIADGAIQPEVIEMLRNAGPMIAPHLIDLEVMNAIRRQRQHGKSSKPRIAQTITDFNALTIERHDTHHLNPRIWELCDNFTSYDASYVALAESLQVPLISRDVKMSNAPGLRTKIIIV